jgi:formylglycine-generating enzyme required for sulfatase activity
MRRVAVLFAPICLALLVEACGRTETSLGAQYHEDGTFGGTAGTAGSTEMGGFAGSAGSAGAGGSAGVILDAGPESDAMEDGDVDAGEDADADVPDADASDGGCVISVPEPTTTGVEGPSCAGGLTCAGTSCCESLLIPGGSFPMGRSDNGSDSYPPGGANEQPEHAAFVSPFHLDRFEVTVGRFRKFVTAYTGTPPAVDAGAHPTIAGSGWQAAWNSKLPTTSAALTSSLGCAAGLSTWTAAPGPNEPMPINCTSWYVSFAFCVWDGGRLPTEAEWEKVAAGADENRRYPWGPQDPESCHAGYAGVPTHVPVGARPAGAGRWGHQDLGGSEWEWTLDYWSSTWYSGAGATCNDCANLTPSAWRTIRGGAWSTFEPDRLRAAFRTFIQPDEIPSNVGFRCAR